MGHGPLDADRRDVTTNLVLNQADLLGLVLSMSRVGAFAAASPLVRVLPVPGRVAFTLAVGLALSEPALSEGAMSDFVAATAVNVGVGVVLGFLTGLFIYAFTVAGAVIDLSSGLNAAQVFDPVTGLQNSVFGRGFNLMAIVLWFVVGGDRLMVEGLAATVATIPLDGTITVSAGVADFAVALVATMLRSAIELAIPALAALFITEVAFGVAARFAPQANVFSIGLPARIIASLATISLVVAAFPSVISTNLDTTRETIVTTIRALGG